MSLYNTKQIQKNNFGTMGITLIEVVVSISIMALLVVTILGIFTHGVRLVSENKFRALASALALQKLEIIKNLPYEKIGTINGIPAGGLLQTENIVSNGSNFIVSSQVIYKDDPSDGILGVDKSELAGTDYKKVKVQVAWTGPFGQKNVSVITNVAPRRNQNETNTGTLSILVFNANGEPVPQADVSINAQIGTTTVAINAQTNNQGKLIYPGAPAGVNAYKIMATKSNFSTDKTCAIDSNGATCDQTQGNPQPTKPHASIIEGELTGISFAIDRVSNLNIRAVRQSLPDQWAVNTDTTTYDQDIPSMTVCPNGHYLYAWRDYRQNNNPRIYIQKYNKNLAVGWSPDFAVTTSNNQNNPDIAADTNCKIYVIWNDDRNGNQDIFLDKFDATPQSEWGGARKIQTSPNSADQTYPQIIINASSTFGYITWIDARDDLGDIYAHKLKPSGDKDWLNEIKVNSDPATATQGLPKIQLDSDENVYFVWHDNRDGSNDIYAQKLNSSGGKLWPNDAKVSSFSSGNDNKNGDFDISSDQYLYVVWQDNRDTHSNIYAQKFDSNGNAIWPNDIKINRDTGEAPQEDPVITEDVSGNFYIAWEDFRNANPDIYMQKINPNGELLMPFDVHIAALNQGNQENPDISINKDGLLTLTWQDNSSGNYDIKSATYSADPQNITNVPNVNLTIQGVKKIGENPVIYKFKNIYLTDGSGNLNLSNIEWDQYGITSSSHSIIQIDPTSPISLNPNQTIDAIIHVQ